VRRARQRNAAEQCVRTALGAPRFKGDEFGWGIDAGLVAQPKPSFISLPLAADGAGAIDDCFPLCRKGS